MKKATIKLITFLVVLLSTYVFFDIANIITWSVVHSGPEYITLTISELIDFMASFVYIGIFIAMLCMHKSMQLTTKASIVGLVLSLVALAIYLFPLLYSCIATILHELEVVSIENVYLPAWYYTASACLRSILYIIAFTLIVLPTQIPLLGKITMIVYPIIQFIRWITLSVLYALEWNPLTTLSTNIQRIIGYTSHISLALIALVLMIITLSMAKKRREADTSIPTITQQ